MRVRLWLRLSKKSEPDLIVTAVDGPTEGAIGGVINVASTEIRNQGASPAGATEVGYYFTTDPAGQPDQTFSGSVCPVPALAGGSTYDCQNIMVSVPGTIAAGPYRLVAIVDDQDLVAEIDETNNHLAGPQPIQLNRSACFPTGDSCASDAQCCSLKCRGGKNKTCKGDTTCTPSEIPETTCTDGQDNDCDGLTDTEDSDCPNGGMCEPKGTTCTADDECCSNKCRGPSGRQSCK